MRRAWLPRIAGLAAGVLLAAAPAGWRQDRSAAAAQGAILSECDGTIRQIAIQYLGGMDFVWPTYREYFAALPADVKVVLIRPGPADRDELLAAIGQPASRFTIVYTAHPMTTWSRDRWLTLTPVAVGDRIELIAPREEGGAETWPARCGDQRLAGDLAAATPGAVASRRSPLSFDGGDFLADGDTVFVSPAVLERNLHRGVESEKELVVELATMLGKKIVLLSNAPPHHVGMYMAICGNHEAVVGDPSLGESLFKPSPLIVPDRSLTTQKQFDDVAAQVQAAGYHVRRIPTVVAADGKTYLTFVNGLIDQRSGRRTFYLPSYRGQEARNRAAAQVWEDLEYNVTPIDCSDVFPHFGTLHCLVNVLERS